ncbi:MAG TPA: hypothetical protein VEC37_00090, partial [Bacillota bacterium]|nr:hypothetical protein [Bacillota bacterium]
MISIDYLLKNSGLPGPRGNLELLYLFAKQATKDRVQECFSLYTEDVQNSPEEFVVMCGIVGYCIINRNELSA